MSMTKASCFVENFPASIFMYFQFERLTQKKHFGRPWPQVDNSTPNIMMEGPLNVALKTAHHEGAELDVQCEAGGLKMFGKQLRG